MFSLFLGGENMLRNNKGQSTLEYIILVAGVIAIIILFVGNSSSPFRTALNNTYTQATNGMEDMANRLRGSRPLAP
jgi:uncharacterized protein (UPF0333 family)